MQVTENQRESITALIASDNPVNLEMVRQLLIGIDDQAFTEECLAQINTRKIARFKECLDKLASISGVSNREVYSAVRSVLRNDIDSELKDILLHVEPAPVFQSGGIALPSHEHVAIIGEPDFVITDRLKSLGSVRYVDVGMAEVLHSLNSTPTRLRNVLLSLPKPEEGDQFPVTKARPKRPNQKDLFSFLDGIVSRRKPNDH